MCKRNARNETKYIMCRCRQISLKRTSSQWKIHIYYVLVIFEGNWEETVHCQLEVCMAKKFVSFFFVSDENKIIFILKDISARTDSGHLKFRFIRNESIRICFFSLLHRFWISWVLKIFVNAKKNFGSSENFREFWKCSEMSKKISAVPKIFGAHENCLLLHLRRKDVGADFTRSSI